MQLLLASDLSHIETGVCGVGYELVLTAADVVGRDRWRWLLSDENGKPLADHPVVLDRTSTEASAFTDFYRFLRWNAAPDRRVDDEAAWVDRVGAWAGRELLGELLGQRLVKRAPVTVRMVLPAGAEYLALWPWELAWAQGQPLARHKVGLVIETAAAAAVGSRPVGSALRMLAVFSLPTAQTALGLRRERYALTRLVRQLAGRRAVQMQVLQYGATRDRLEALVQTGDGWDVVHLSGHGGAGQLLLEHPDGSPDPVSTDELVELLRQAQRRPKLAVVSACESAAATTAETLRLLGATGPAEELETQAQAEIAADGGVDVGLARGLAEQLGCAVLAMRYPVVDDFAVDLAGRFYRGLFDREQSVDVALRLALPAAAGRPSVASPALSLGTPTLLGASAAGLVLTPPRATPAPAGTPMARFPDEPERFVGRTGPMARASAVLAVDSAAVGVVFHGMAGAGKTTCAVELAYRHVDSFATTVFWKAPTNPDLFDTALTSLALSLDRQLDAYGLPILDKISPADQWERFLPELAELVEQYRLLIVLDNLETLLTPDGVWRDPRWEPLIAALTGHRGESRLVATSRILPAGLDRARVVTVPVHALSRDETVLLARELPGLRALLHTDPTPERARNDPAAYAARAEADRRLARRVLDVVQGHPKLLELADAAAADPVALTAHLTATDTALTSHDHSAVETFFIRGDSTLDPDGFLTVLAGWAQSTVQTLPAPARLLLQILCAVEEDDRTSFVLAGNWEDMWRRLDQPGDPPPLADTLAPLVTAALVHPAPAGDGQEPPVVYQIHPGVADTVRTHTDPAIRTAVDHELAAYWTTVSRQARDREGGEAGQVVVHAGLAAAPYLLHLAAYDQAGTLLEQALRRDNSPGVAQAAVPFLRRIATTTHAAKDAGVLAAALSTVDVVEAEQLLRDALTQASDQQDHSLASTASGALVVLLRYTGRLDEALAMADTSAGHTRAAGLGPWTQLGDQAMRLQILARQGHHDQVLTDLHPLHERMDTLPDPPPPNPPEAAEPWNVRELLLDTGHTAAMALGRWEQAMSYNAAIYTSETRRNAGAHELARTRFNDTGPLIRLGRLNQADQLLQVCQQTFTDHDDIPALSKTLSTRADLEDERGRPDLAADLARTALRYSYLHPDPQSIAISHHNLAGYLRALDDPQGACAHRLTAALIYQLTGHHMANMLQALGSDLRRLGAQPAPSTLEELAAVVDQTDGVHLIPLITRLCPDTAAATALITTLLHTAERTHLQQLYERWDPRIAAVVAAAGGDQDTAAALEPFLDQMATTDDWAALAGVWRRILTGERDPATLTPGLDDTDTVIVTRTLDTLTGQEPS